MPNTQERTRISTATRPRLGHPTSPHLPLPSHSGLVATTGVAIRKGVRSCPIAPRVLFPTHSQARHPISFRRTLRLAIQRRFGRLGVVIGPNGLLLRIRWLRLAKVLPLAPAVKVDERLHAAPFHHFAREPFEVHRLRGYQYAEC